jgi:TP901 family phage tail tape measure protein
MSDTLRWATELDASGFASGAQRVNSSLGEMGFRTSAATMNLGGLGTMIGSLANPMTLAAGAAMALGAALTGSVQAAAAWQSSMSGVSKTTGLTGQDLSVLSKELLEMSTRMPAAASEIANVAQVAGSLGIAAQDIASFTEVAIQMGVGFEMSAEQAATSGAKILTAFKLDTTAENMEKLGSVVNAMGDSFAATEPQVLDFLNRASFLNTTMGQTIPQIAALGTVLISTGLDADVAATGLKSFLNMATSVRSKTGGMDKWAALLNTSVEELKANLAGDFNQTLIDTANAIAAISDPVERFQKAVALAGTEGAPTLLKLAGQQENLAKALGLTNAEWENATSLQKTYDAQASTMNSQLQIFWNTLNMAGVELGTVFLPYVTSAIQFMNDLVKISIKVGEEIYKAFQPIADLFEGGGSGPSGFGMAWDAMKDWAGIGKEHADQMAKEIEENERLQKAGAEAIQVGIDKGIFKDAGTAAGGEVGEAMTEEMKTVIINQAAGVNTVWADSIAQAMKDYGVGMLYTGGGNSRWKDSIGQVLSSTTVDSVGIAAVKEATVTGTDLVLKTENGKELARRDIYVGEWAENPVGAIYDMIRETTDLSGLSDIQSAELAGDMERADLLKIQAAKIETEIEAVNIWDNFNSEASLLKFETDNKDAFDKVSDIVETNLYRAARDIEQNGPVVADLLGSSMGLAAGQVDPATLDESLQNVLNALADPGSVDTAILETSLAHLMGASLISASDSEEIKDAAEVAAKGYKSALFGALAESTENRSIAEMRAAGWTGIEDFAAWSKNEYQPTLKSEISEMNELWDKGYGANRDTTREYLELMMKDHEEHSEWFEDWQNHYIDLLQSGVLNEDQFFDAWENMVGKADEKAATALDEIKSANAMFYGEFLSDNARWQSYVNEYGGYVGPTKLYGGYRDAMDAEIVAAQEVNQKYGISTVGSIGMVAELDTTEALSATEALVADIGAMAPDMVLTLDIDHALTTWVNFFADIETTNPTMHVTVDIDANAQDIAAKVEAAIVEALA